MPTAALFKIEKKRQSCPQVRGQTGGCQRRWWREGATGDGGQKVPTSRLSKKQVLGS